MNQQTVAPRNLDPVGLPLPVEPQYEVDTTSRLLKDRCPLIFAQIDQSKNEGIALEKLTRGSTKKLWWICVHCKGSYAAVISTRTRNGDKPNLGHGECSRKINKKRARLTTEEFIARAKIVHTGDQYCYKAVEYKNNHTYVNILCTLCKTMFPQVPHAHLDRQGCPTCGRLKSNNGQRSTKEEFVKRAMLMHKQLYGYDDVVYVNNYTHVTIFCYACKKSFPQTPTEHLRTHGCWKCAMKLVRSNTKSFIERAELIHSPGHYDYSKVDYHLSNEHVIIRCTICNVDFPQTPNDHLNGKGCDKCGNKRRGDALRSNTQNFVKAASEKYPDGQYTYTKTVYVSRDKKVVITCTQCGNDFSQRACDHLRGHDGCDTCRRVRRDSKGAANCLRYIIERKMPYYIREKSLDGLPGRRYDFCFYYNDRWYILEFDGGQHFKYITHWHDGPEDFLFRQEIDKLKNLVALMSGYIVIRLHCNEYESIASTLDYFLSLPVKGPFLGVDSIHKYDFMFDQLNVELLMQMRPDYETLVTSLKDADLTGHIFESPTKPKSPPVLESASPRKSRLVIITSSS